MTTTVVGSFLDRAFSGDAAKIEEAFVAAGREAHKWSHDAQIASGRSTHHPYGSTFWLALPEEVNNTVGPLLEGAQVVPVPGVPYSILIVNGVAILPVKVIEGGARDDRMCVSLSELRARLARLNHDYDPNQASFFDTDQDHHDAAGEDLTAVLEELEKERKAIEAIASTLVVAAYRCGPASGLRAVEVGVATFDSDGFIDFIDSQKLSLLGDPLPFPKATPVVSDTFDTAPRRKARLELHEEPAADGDTPEPK